LKKGSISAPHMLGEGFRERENFEEINGEILSLSQIESFKSVW